MTSSKPETPEPKTLMESLADYKATAPTLPYRPTRLAMHMAGKFDKDGPCVHEAEVIVGTWTAKAKGGEAAVRKALELMERVRYPAYGVFNQALERVSKKRKAA